MHADLRNGSKRRERGRRGSCYDPSSMHSCMVTVGKRLPSFSYVFRICRAWRPSLRLRSDVALDILRADLGYSTPVHLASPRQPATTSLNAATWSIEAALSLFETNLTMSSKRAIRGFLGVDQRLKLITMLIDLDAPHADGASTSSTSTTSFPKSSGEAFWTRAAYVVLHGTQVSGTGQTTAHCGASEWPSHSVHFFASIT